MHNEFLPYGEHLVASGLNIEKNDYLYGGKELQDRFGVNLYDSGARFQANTVIHIFPLTDAMETI